MKWDSGVNITDPTFKGVTVDADSYEIMNAGKVNMFGLYSPLFVPKDANVYFLGDNNRLYAAQDNMTINAFRACFLYTGMFTV